MSNDLDERIISAIKMEIARDMIEKMIDGVKNTQENIFVWNYPVPRDFSELGLNKQQYVFLNELATKKIIENLKHTYLRSESE